MATWESDQVQLRFLDNWTSAEMEQVIAVFSEYSSSNTTADTKDNFTFSYMDGYCVDGTRVYFIRRRRETRSITAYGRVDLLSKITDIVAKKNL